MRGLRDALSDLRRRSWARYRAVPGRYRWPLTIVPSFFVIIILANLIFGGGGEPQLRTFRLDPLGEQQTRMRVDAGRNSEVRWSLTSVEGEGTPSIEAVVTGPDFVSDVSSALDGTISFKAGFSGGRYAFSMRNLSPDTGGTWAIEWGMR